MNISNNIQKVPASRFGVSSEQFNTIKNVLEFCSVYGFSENEAEFAYSISKENNVSLESAFEFVDELKLSYGNICLAKNSKDFPFDTLAYLYFHFNLSVAEAKEDIWNLRLQSYKKFSESLKMALEVYYSKSNSLLGYDIEACKEIGAALDKNGLDSSDWDDILLYAHSDDVTDVIDVIENYTEYTTAFYSMAEECMNIDFSDDKTIQCDRKDLYDEFLSSKYDISNCRCDRDPDYNINSDDTDFDHDASSEPFFDF